MLDLVRLESTRDSTLGAFRINGELICWCLENPWRGNSPNRSCIPAGVYDLVWVDSPKFGSSIELDDVYGRTHILIHAGNVSIDTRGCLLPGMQVGQLRGERAVLRSQDALTILEERVKDSSITRITITEVW